MGIRQIMPWWVLLSVAASIAIPLIVLAVVMSAHSKPARSVTHPVTVSSQPQPAQRRGSVSPAAPSGTSKLNDDPALAFPAILQGTANAYARPRHLPLISNTTCVPGNPTHYLCAFILGGKTCRIANVIHTKLGEIIVSQAGRVAVSSLKNCKIRLILKGKA